LVFWDFLGNQTEESGIGRISWRTGDFLGLMDCDLCEIAVAKQASRA